MPHSLGTVDAAHLLTQLRKARNTAIQELRRSFTRHGLDVSAYGGHEIGEALLQAPSAPDRVTLPLVIVNQQTPPSPARSSPL